MLLQDENKLPEILAKEENQDIETDVIVKKCGVLTDGSFRVREVLTSDGASEDRVLGLAASIELHSEHPLAKGYRFE